ncbi:MAG: transposase [Pseudomonadota bacterium]
MTEYRRSKLKGGTYFFTVNCAERRGNRLLENNVDVLRQIFRHVKNAHPFDIDAIVVLPEHLHCIWTLPQDDDDFGIRWALIKAGFSRLIPRGERCSKSRINRGERGIWQRRYWEHLIRDEQDFTRHVDYIHWNPVKHGWVNRVREWPYSSFHTYVQKGIYPADWACDPGELIGAGE